MEQNTQTLPTYIVKLPMVQYIWWTSLGLEMTLYTGVGPIAEGTAKGRPKAEGGQKGEAGNASRRA